MMGKKTILGIGWSCKLKDLKLLARMPLLKLSVSLDCSRTCVLSSSFRLWVFYMIIFFHCRWNKYEHKTNTQISFWAIQVQFIFIPMGLIQVFAYFKSEHRILRLDILDIIIEKFVIFPNH